MSSVYFPSEAAHLHSYACPVVEAMDTISHRGKIQSRSCKRQYEGLQVQPSLLLSFFARILMVKLYVELYVKLHVLYWCCSNLEYYNIAGKKPFSIGCSWLPPV